MARFDEESPFTENIWRRLAWVVFMAACLFGGQELAVQVGADFEPFNLPVLIGFGTGLAIFYSQDRLFPPPIDSNGADLENESGYVDNLWWKWFLNSTWYNVVSIVVMGWFLVTWLYPQAYKTAFVEGRSHDAFMLGFWGSILLIACFSVARDLLRKRVSL